MSSARPPVVVRQHSPDKSFQLKALEVLLKIGSKKAAGTSGGEDARKEINGSGNSILHDQR